LSLGAFELSVLVFSGAFALSIATGSNRNGFELVFSLMVVYYAVKMLHSAFWVDLPFWIPGNSYASGAYDWLLTGQQVRYMVLLLMFPATAVLPFLAQLGFARKDL
jgi:hypothetical protein